MRTIRSKLTYANVISTLCLFLLLGGGAALAAGKLGKNSVGTKQIKNQAVTAAKIKKGTITGTQVKNGSLTGTQVNASTLGTVPSATSAATANALSAPEALHVVGQPGQPPFEGGSTNLTAPGISLAPVSFYKDKEGVVHLEGYAQVGKEGIGTLTPIFTLPPGFRPANEQLQIFAAGPEAATLIAGTSSSFEGHSFNGNVLGETEKASLLSGITFRAQG